MRRLTPYNHRRATACLAEFYARRIRNGRDLYQFQLGYRPGAAPAPRTGFWARLFGKR